MNKPTVTGQNTNDVIAESIEADVAQIDRKEYIEVVPNVRLHIRDWGAGQPIVFIHGWPYSNDIFEYQFVDLAQKGFRCIGITLRGFGKSDQPFGEYSFDTLSDDIHKVLSLLDIDNCTLVGFSTGAAVAVRYMTLHMQARVDRMVLISGVLPGLNTKNSLLGDSSIENIVAACLKDRSLAVEDFSKSLFADNKPPSFIQWLNHSGMQASPNATQQMLRSVQKSDLTSEFSKITVPTLLLNGTKDNVLSFNSASELQKRVAGSTLSVFENCGHALLLEDITQCNKLLAEFAAVAK
ncbi:MAG: alpha/beta hydrolase [Bacteroidia bacterium]|jgi:pimeloyl-ACP methyl ester carboxylesterase